MSTFASALVVDADWRKCVERAVVTEMTVYIYQGLPTIALRDHVTVPNFLEKSLAGHGHAPLMKRLLAQ